MSPLVLLDYVGVALFAATGALAASRKQLDIIGFLFLGAVTGVGGGTARDLILGVPVFWVEQHLYVLVCAVSAGIVYFTARLIESRYRMLLWLDAVALSAYGVFGAYKGLLVTESATVAVAMGMITGTLGGIFRDVLAREPSVLMRQEIYVAAALSGAVAFVTAHSAGVSLSSAAGAGFLLALGVRSGAVLLGWPFPAYRSRPRAQPEGSALIFRSTRGACRDPTVGGQGPVIRQAGARDGVCSGTTRSWCYGARYGGANSSSGIAMLCRRWAPWETSGTGAQPQRSWT